MPLLPRSAVAEAASCPASAPPPPLVAGGKWSSAMELDFIVMPRACGGAADTTWRPRHSWHQARLRGSSQCQSSQESRRCTLTGAAVRTMPQLTP